MQAKELPGSLQIRDDLPAAFVETCSLGRDSDASRCPVQQPYLELRLQARDRFAYAGGRDPELVRRFGEAVFLCRAHKSQYSGEWVHRLFQG